MAADGTPKTVMPRVEQRSHKRLNNRAENSHLPLRKRARVMQGFRSTGGLQRFTSVFSAVRKWNAAAGLRAREDYGRADCNLIRLT